MNIWLQGWWAYFLLYGAIKIFNMHLNFDNLVTASTGPIVLLVRHSSTADTVLNAVLVAKKHKLLLRYVLKKELLWDPCLDVVGNRLPNVFIDRSGHQTEKELNAIINLTKNLNQSEGILIYPEGTRFSEEKLTRARKHLNQSGEHRLLAKAKQMQFVLPPRPGGVITILQNAPTADLVFCAHTGFEGASNFKKFFNGELIGKTIYVKYWRVTKNDIPKDTETQIEWIFDQWLMMDKWIAEKLNNTKNPEHLPLN